MSLRRLLAVAVLAAGCATSRAPSAPAPAAAAPREPAAVAAPAPRVLPATGLELAVEPPEAIVTIDGQSRGEVAALEDGVVALPPGIYQVSLKAPGFVTWRAEVAVRAGRERLQVRLARRTDGGGAR
jgi:hypothetical protein